MKTGRKRNKEFRIYFVYPLSFFMQLLTVPHLLGKSGSFSPSGTPVALCLSQAELRAVTLVPDYHTLNWWLCNTHLPAEARI